MELLIVTYHYIGEKNKYRGGVFPINHLDFLNQIDLIGRRFKFISENDLLAAISDKKQLSDRSCLVTFDDNLKCQYKYALPILREKKIPAVFFVYTLPYQLGKACAAHKLHHLLSANPVDELFRYAEEEHLILAGRKIDWFTFNLKKASNWYRYDKQETAKLKYLINHFLVRELADKIIENIFAKYFNQKEEDFCKEIYLSVDEIEEINNDPLFSIGMHTHSHSDISSSSDIFVKEDLINNYNYLNKNFKINKINGLSYPFGSITENIFNDKISKIIKPLNIKYGLTIEKGINADLGKPFMLKRMNPNDLLGGKRPLVNF
jgi:peptidoglycan/xylan/chitin deacetylase (PgdA/CDA1 family)